MPTMVCFEWTSPLNNEIWVIFNVVDAVVAADVVVVVVVGGGGGGGGGAAAAAAGTSFVI